MIRSVDEIYMDMENCTRCKLFHLRQQMTWPAGNVNARWFFVLGPPDEDSDNDVRGRTLAGHRRRKFVDLLGRAGIALSDVRMSPILRCLPQTVLREDRPPTEVELAACGPRLKEEILAVDPTILVLVGAQAIRPFWTGQKAKITKIANTFREMEVEHGGISATFPTLIIRSLSTLLTNDPDWAPNGIGVKAIDALQTADRFVSFLTDLREKPEYATSLSYRMPALKYHQKLDKF